MLSSHQKTILSTVSKIEITYHFNNDSSRHQSSISLIKHVDNLYLSSLSSMNSKDDDPVSDAFDIPDFSDTQAFILDSDVLKSSPLLNKTSQYDDHLRVTIGEPLIYALTYILTYRPEDPIEFIASK